ncbi:hypothetical protein JKF63_02989 [Porcisia hertigi]|uniref:Uncharacterized protein n=1 Tax=Porcisia hertigi TaxID=2761500 RepID=A0A836IIY1_9TRYP|nr:hypothetical protein JKF63_02989 [Porcisia hertigi]
MKFTHREIEEDRAKPVGSLFMHLMDRDSMPSRSHRNRAAQQLNAHSLSNTQLSLYAQDARQLPSTPLRGRRHFPRSNSHVDCNTQEYVRPSTGVRFRSPFHGSMDHIGRNMTPRGSSEVSTPRQRRYVPPPGKSSSKRPFWLGDDTISIKQRHSCGSGSAILSPSPGHHTFMRNRSTANHLTVGSLVPLPEKEVEKVVPPPLPRKPRREGIRMFPERHSRSVADVHRGIRMVQPQAHWRSAADRHLDFLELGIASHEAPALRYSNESHFQIGESVITPRESPAPLASTPRWRGGRRSNSTPAPRRFDIITGRPLVY